MEVKRLEDLKIGLVLAGGGAKGAYEVGVFKALNELNLVNAVKAVSGTSVGAVNALLLSMNDKQILDNSWSNLSYSRFIMHQESSRRAKITSLINKIKSLSLDINVLDQIRLNDIGLFSQRGIKSFINEYIDINVIKESDKAIYACAYNIEDGIPEYFRLNDYNEKEMMSIVLASCAIPFIFRPITIGEKKYADGGIQSPEYSIKNVDNIPISPLKPHECNLIIVVHLSFKHKLNREGFENTNIVEIFPSTPLELISGTGSLRINSSTLREHIELGYRDAMVILAPIIIKILKGEDFKEIIERNDESNDILLKRK